MVGLLRYFRKHRMQPPLGALIAPPEQGGLSRVGGGTPAPWVRPHPGLARSPPPCFGLLARPGWLPHWCSGRSVEFWMGLLVVLLERAFLIVHFGVFSCIALQNIYIPKLMENVSCKP